jgi:hypothetical protein
VALVLPLQGPLGASQKLEDGATVLVPTLRGAEGSSQLATVASDVAKSYATTAKELEDMVKPRVVLLGKMSL